MITIHHRPNPLLQGRLNICIHYQSECNPQQDQCVVNQWDDYTQWHGERFHCPGCAIPRRAYARRKDSVRRCKRCSNDSELHKTEEPNDVFTPTEYGAYAEEEKEGCSGDAYSIHPGGRQLELLASCDWRS